MVPQRDEKNPGPYDVVESISEARLFPSSLPCGRDTASKESLEMGILPLLKWDYKNFNKEYT